MKAPVFSTLYFLLFTLCLKAQLIADFSSNIISGCSPIVVSFNDLSTLNGSSLPHKSILNGDAYNSHNWNLGNGNTSTLQNPGATYNTPGTYTVTLTVSDGSNNDTETKIAYITVFARPTANFSGTPVSGCVPLSVNFSDLSTPGSGAINQWFWDFGDGQNSTQQNPAHSYSSPGNYTVSLIVTDINGCSRSVTTTNYINAFNGPTANFNAPFTSSCSIPFSVNYNNSSTGSGGLTYQWAFPGGTPSSSASQNPTVNYNTAGSFSATLIVTDGGGCSSTFVQNNFIRIIQANFSGSPQSGCAPFPVNFSNTSLGNPTSWNWNFGDSTTSTQQNPTHIYTVPGVYTVSFTVGNGTCTETETKISYITVGTMPEIFFTASDTTPCQIPTTIFFEDSTAGAISWQWSFGDGTTSAVENPSHTYTAAGIYDVSLVVSVSNGCKDTLIKTDYIVLQNPDAIFDGDTTKGCAPLTVQFSDASVSGSAITSWNWVFGDGNTSNVQNPLHTFIDTGKYTVKLYITNAQGCTDSAAILVWAGLKPTANYSASPVSGCRPLTVDFTDASSNIANMWLWTFGDGSTDTTQNPTHIYNDTGSFDVTLIVSNNGCRDTLTFNDYITVFPPRANFSVLPGTTGCSLPFTVTLEDESQGADTWFWDFGNGNTFTGQNPPPFTYDSGGQFTIKLVVTNAGSGCSDSTTQTIRISGPLASFSVSGTGCQPLLASFSDSSYSPFGIRNWEWNFGDGNSLNNLGGQPGTSTVPNGTNNYLTTGTYKNPKHTYMYPGTYTVTLIITDQLVCTDTIILTNIITVSAIPIVNITSDKQNGCPPFTVQFFDISTGTVGMAQWSWNFGDGSTDTVENPVHTYDSSGSFKVTLIATDSNGCISGIVQNNYINVISPSAGFISNTGSCVGISQLFTDTSSSSSPISSWFWDFGDGSTDTLENPSHIFGGSGVFDITLAITDTSGCVDTVVRPDHMTVQSVVAGFGADTTTANCPPLLVQFSDSSTGGIVSWFWQFGNGNSSTLSNPKPLYNSPGKFDVTLIVTSSLGCKDTLVEPELIQIDGPNGDLFFIPDSGCPGTIVAFDTVNVENAIDYTWDFGDGNVVISAPPLTHKYLEVGIFHPFLTFQDLAGCSFGVQATDSIQIVNIPVDAGPDKTVCEGDSTMLQASGGISYTWTPAGTLSNNLIYNPMAGPANTSKYYVLVSDADGCKNNDSVMVFVNHNLPAANFSSSSACDNDVTLFNNLSTIQNDTIISWNWIINNGEAQSSDTNPAYFFSSPGLFDVWLEVISNKGCVDSVTKQVTVFPLPDGDAGNDTVVCAGESAMLLASGGISYSWMTDATLSDSSISNPLATPESSNTYYVIVKDANNCIDTDSVFVSVNPLPVADAGNGTQICLGDSTMLNASGGIIYSWSPSSSLSNLSIANPYASSTDTSEYFVSVTDINGCVNIDSVTIIVNPNYPVADFTATTVCNNEVTFFSDQSGITGDTIISWEWDFDDGVPLVSDTNPSYVFSSAGNFSVSLTVTTNTGCKNSKIQTITVHPLPVAEAGNDTSVCIGKSAPLQASGGVSYAWIADATLSDTSTASTIATPALSNPYYVIVKDINNCIDTDTVVVFINPLPPANAGTDFQICLGDTAMLNASGGIIYSWTYDISLSDTTIANPYIFPIDTTEYFVRVKDINGCENVDSVLVIVNPNFPFAGFTATTVCKNDTTFFTDQSTVTGDTIVGWEWNFDDAIPNETDTNPAIVFSSAGNFYVSLTITTNKGCKDSTMDTIIVFQLPVADAGTDTAICIGKSVDLEASGGISYAWMTDPTLADTSDSSTVATPLSLNSYYVIVKDVNNCIDTDTVAVIINPLPIATAGADIQICLGQNIVLNAGGGEIYSWKPDSTLTNPNVPNPTATPVDTTDYLVTVTDSNGCINKDTVRIIVNPNYPLAIFNASTVCEEKNTEFTDMSSIAGDTIVKWSWNFGDLSTDTLNSPSHLYSQYGTYQVTLVITTNNNCTDTLTKDVIVNSKPEADFTVEDNCLGKITNFTNNSVIGQGSLVSHLWTFGDNTSSITADPSHTYSLAGIFNVSLIVKSDSNCADTVITTIEIFQKPVPGFISEIVCLKEATQFDDTSIVDPSVSITSWAWNFGDGIGFSSDPDPTYSFSSAGSYYVTLVVATGGIASCEASIIKEVIVNPLPVLNCDAVPMETNTSAPEIQFFSDPAQSYSWDFAGLDTSSLREPAFSFTDSGLFTVTLIASNNLGCLDTCQLDIRVKPTFEMSVPNAFTPNHSGPNGGEYSINPFNNDVFFPVTKYIIEYQLLIYDRWGELIFISEDLKIGWDGYYHGVLCQQDVYVWKIKATFADGTRIKKTGDVTLIR